MSDDKDVTLGEVYRLCQAINARTLQMQADADKESHSLRNYINEHALILERHDGALRAVEKSQAGARNWIAGLVSGGLVAAFAWLLDWVKQP